jgi:hypothetical protein
MSFSKRLFEAIHDGVEADEPPPAECDCGDPRCCGDAPEYSFVYVEGVGLVGAEVDYVAVG